MLEGNEMKHISINDEAKSAEFQVVTGVECDSCDDLKLLALIGFARGDEENAERNGDLYREFLKKVGGCD